MKLIELMPQALLCPCQEKVTEIYGAAFHEKMEDQFIVHPITAPVGLETSVLTIISIERWSKGNP